jgi:hypothetical protein
MASERLHRERHLQHLFYSYFCVTSPCMCLHSRSIATAVRVTCRDTYSTVACGHYLATAVSLTPQFLLSVNTPQYSRTRHFESSLYSRFQATECRCINRFWTLSYFKISSDGWNRTRELVNLSQCGNHQTRPQTFRNDQQG